MRNSDQSSLLFTSVEVLALRLEDLDGSRVSCAGVEALVVPRSDVKAQTFINRCPIPIFHPIIRPHLILVVDTGNFSTLHSPLQTMGIFGVLSKLVPTVLSVASSILHFIPRPNKENPTLAGVQARLDAEKE